MGGVGYDVGYAFDGGVGAVDLVYDSRPWVIAFELTNLRVVDDAVTFPST